TAAQLQEQQKKSTLLGNLRFVEVPDGLSPSSDGAPAVPPPHPMVRLKLFMAAAEAGTLREALETARASAGGARVTCVVGDSFMWMAAKAAAEVEAPWVAVWTGGPSALLAHLRADALRDDVGDKVAEGFFRYSSRKRTHGCIYKVSSSSSVDAGTPPWEGFPSLISFNLKAPLMHKCRALLLGPEPTTSTCASQICF
uniref:Uncharacterized protein n=1 Tax=Aegilops tauschii subsp. strangulata TaxID=200361 RepID=A0A452XKQ7_AEGTS